MRNQRGFTLVEIAIVLVIIGLLLGGILRGQELIQGARVRNVIDQQNGVRAAFFGFQDRFRLIPGNIPSTQIAQVGNGANASTLGTAGTGAIAQTESPLVFQNLTATGFLSCGVCTATGPAGGTAANSPVNVYGGVLQVATDTALAEKVGAATFNNALTVARTSSKTGNLIPSNVMAEIDVKADDGNAYTGNLRGSTWSAGNLNNPDIKVSCASGSTAAASPWNNGQSAAPGGAIAANCGGGMLF